MQRVRIDIPQETLEQFCRAHHIQRLSIFGSAVRDDFGPESDVDLLVEFEQGHTPGLAFIRIQDELSRIFGGRPVDLITHKSLDRWMRKEVMAEAQVVYAQE